jgi:hypothetical protein
MIHLPERLDGILLPQLGEAREERRRQRQHDGPQRAGGGAGERVITEFRERERAAEDHLVDLRHGGGEEGVRGDDRGETPHLAQVSGVEARASSDARQRRPQQKSGGDRLRAERDALHREERIGRGREEGQQRHAPADAQRGEDDDDGVHANLLSHAEQAALIEREKHGAGDGQAHPPQAGGDHHRVERLGLNPVPGDERRRREDQCPADEREAEVQHLHRRQEVAAGVVAGGAVGRARGAARHLAVQGEAEPGVHQQTHVLEQHHHADQTVRLGAEVPEVDRDREEVEQHRPEARAEVGREVALELCQASHVWLSKCATLFRRASPTSDVGVTAAIRPRPVLECRCCAAIWAEEVIRSVGQRPSGRFFRRPAR